MKMSQQVQELAVSALLVEKGYSLSLCLSLLASKDFLLGSCIDVCFLFSLRSLIANLSAANCYKVEHLKKPENWALGNKLIALFYWIVSHVRNMFPFLGS